MSTCCNWRPWQLQISNLPLLEAMSAAAVAKMQRPLGSKTWPVGTIPLHAILHHFLHCLSWTDQVRGAECSLCDPWVKMFSRILHDISWYYITLHIPANTKWNAGLAWGFAEIQFVDLPVFKAGVLYLILSYFVSIFVSVSWSGQTPTSYCNYV